MGSAEKVELLRGVDLFEPLAIGEVEDLGRRMPEIRLEKGRMLYRPAYRGGVLFVLLRGRVRLYKTVGMGEVTLGMVSAGEVFGEAILTAKGRQGAYAQAEEPSVVALLGVETLQRLVRERPEVGLKAMELLSERLHFCEERMGDMGLKEVPERLAGLLLHLVRQEGVETSDGYRIPTRYTHEQLGAMVGAGRVAATRALGRLRKEGIVEIRRRHIHVGSLEALEGAARGRL